MKSLIVLGDSIVARERQDGVAALLPRLRHEFPTVETKSYAVGGANSRQCLTAIRDVQLPTNSLALVSLGMNDAAPWKRVPLDEFVSNYQQILEKCIGSTAVLLAPYPVDTTKQQPPGRDNELILLYAHAVIKLAREAGRQFIDAFRLISDEMRTGNVHIADGVHLNEDGYSTLFGAVRLVVAQWFSVEKYN